MFRNLLTNWKKASFRSYSGLLALALACSLWQVASLPVSAAAEPNSVTATVHPAYVPIVGPVTIKATATFDKSWDTDSIGSNEIPLFTLYTDADGSKVGLSFAWAHTTANWLQIWELQMRDNAGLHPVLLTSGGQDTADRKADSIGLGSSMPTGGHTYDLALSYDPTIGYGSLRLLDYTDGTTLFAGNFQTEVTKTTLYVPTRVTGGNDQLISRSIKPVEQGFIPVGTTWSVGNMNDNVFFPVSLFAPEDKPYIELNAPGEKLAGEYRLTLNQPQQETQIQIEPSSTAVTHSRLPQLPLGKSTVTLEYVQNSRVLWSDSASIRVGKSHLYLDTVVLDHAQKQITTSLHADGDTLPSLPVSIRATFSKLVWNDQQHSYKEQSVEESALFDGVVNSGAGVTDERQVSLRMPTQPGFYKATITATASTDDYAVQSDSVDKYLAVQAPAQPSPDKPYTVVVLPDSQHYARLYPMTELRQSDWIAANAQERNIALILHMGDLTHNNNNAQWKNAYEGLSLLDGIVPYVVTLGNHDFLVGASNVKRSATLFNNYFHADNFPLLAGVFEEGKLNNSYHLTTIAGVQYLIMSLEFAPRNEVLDWANQVVASYPNHKVIMITHTYTSQSGQHKVIESADRKFAESMNDGTEMWSKFVSQHPNIMMVFSGHLGVETVPRGIAVGDAGNRVYEMLADYQNEPNGGNGWMLLVEFRPDQTVHVQAYSPYLNAYKTDIDQYGFDNDFVIDLVNGVYKKP